MIARRENEYLYLERSSDGRRNFHPDKIKYRKKNVIGTRRLDEFRRYVRTSLNANGQVEGVRLFLESCSTCLPCITESVLRARPRRVCRVPLETRLISDAATDGTSYDDSTHRKHRPLWAPTVPVPADGVAVETAWRGPERRHEHVVPARGSPSSSSDISSKLRSTARPPPRVSVYTPSHRILNAAVRRGRTRTASGISDLNRLFISSSDTRAPYAAAPFRNGVFAGSLPPPPPPTGNWSGGA